MLACVEPCKKELVIEVDVLPHLPIIMLSAVQESCHPDLAVTVA
jgi:hypothetical protein